MSSSEIENILKSAWDNFSVTPDVLLVPIGIYRAFRAGFRMKVGRRPTGGMRQRKRTVCFRQRIIF